MTPSDKKEEILQNNEYDVHYYGGGRSHILEAMDEYAKHVSKEEVIDFILWANKNSLDFSIGDIAREEAIEIYNQFLTEQSTQDAKEEG